MAPTPRPQAGKLARRSLVPEGTQTTYDFPGQVLKPRERTCGEFIWSEGKFLTRTPMSWCQLLFFYTIFYIGLSALFAICMKGLLFSLNRQEPKWKLAESLIGTNPGLGFRPTSHDVDQGSLIWYDATNKTQVDYWVHRVDEFLSEYQVSARNQKACDFDSPPNAKQVCILDTTKFGNCSREQSYGYDKSAPCIFLKLNRIFGWVPEYYNDPADLPEEMPQPLKDHIAALPPNARNQVWISCQGEDGMDKEIIGPASYYPTRGFPSYFYPYKNLPGYVSPLVAVQFTRPALSRIVNIECRTWAKNIEYSGSKRDRKGSVHFEIMIDHE